jgi:hypothetical protein
MGTDSVDFFPDQVDMRLSGYVLRDGAYHRVASASRWRYWLAYSTIAAIVVGIAVVVFTRTNAVDALTRALERSGVLFWYEVDDDEALDELPPASGERNCRWSEDDARAAQVEDQGRCNSCWAFAIGHCMHARHEVHTGQAQPPLSAQSLLDAQPDTRRLGVPTCTRLSLDKCGCGSTMASAFRAARDVGMVRADCAPYRASKANALPGNDHRLCETAPNCFHHPETRAGACARVRFNQVYEIHTEEAAWEELTCNGPLVAALAVTQSLASPRFDRDGLLIVDDGAVVRGLHAVCVVGGGTTPGGTDYWLIRNSWGTQWGDGGYAKVRRGVNALGLADASTGQWFYVGVF